MSHDNDRLAERAIIVVGAEHTDEGLVNLEVVDVELLEVRQRGIASAKVIDGNLNSGVAESEQPIDDVGIGVKQQTFGDFDDDCRARNSKAVEMVAPGVMWNVALGTKLHRRRIHTDLETVGNNSMPAIEPTSCFAEHPVANFDDEPRFFRQRDELCGTNHAAFWMVPAQERFGFVDSSRGQVNDGLEVHTELTGS